MAITLEDILALVGTLDDTPGENTARMRFRSYLKKSATTVAVLRDYIEICLRRSGPQYSRALQDLVNHTGQLIGFDVEFGRYQGVTNDIGFDGIWSTSGLALVIEVKTTDAYTIDTSTLVGYVDRLIGASRIIAWDHALGLYVLGRADPGVTQLEHSIVGQKRVSQLRVATVDTVLSLAELRQNDLISLEEAVALLRPTTVRVDDLVTIITRVAAQAESAVEPAPEPVVLPTAHEIQPQPSIVQQVARPSIDARQGGEDVRLYLLTPLSGDERGSAKEILESLLGKGWYVFGNRTPGRKDLKPGDRLCFYESGVGVIAEAEVAGAPELKSIPFAKEPERFPWTFQVRNVCYFFDDPVVVDASLRLQLDAFKGRNADAPWAWLVQGTHKVTAHDFQVLVGHSIA